MEFAQVGKRLINLDNVVEVKALQARPAGIDQRGRERDALPFRVVITTIACDGDGTYDIWLEGKWATEFLSYIPGGSQLIGETGL